MKCHVNAAKIIEWLPGDKPVTVAQIVEAGLLPKRQASYAMDYAADNGCFDRIRRKYAGVADRVLFKYTGKPLPTLESFEPSFEPLLTAWGFPVTPPEITTVPCRKYGLSFSDREEGRGRRHESRPT